MNGDIQRLRDVATQPGKEAREPDKKVNLRAALRIVFHHIAD